MTETEQFFNVLFCSTDSICYGNRYATKVFSMPYESGPEYFSINALHPIVDFGDKSDDGRRADINVTCFRNFLFEMDSVPLDVQKRIMFELDCFTTIVYSGGKSLHGIISLEQPLDLLPHDMEAVQVYKKTWEMLSGYLTMRIQQTMGLPRPPGKDSFFDSACKNASRLSRFPNSIRSDNNRKQEVLYIGTRMGQLEFEEMLSKAPKIYRSVVEPSEAYEDEPISEKEFFARAGKGLERQIKDSNHWAASEGVYPTMYRICTWSIDKTNVSKELLLDIFEQYVYNNLRVKGYPEYKMNNAIDHAFRKKRKRR